MNSLRPRHFLLLKCKRLAAVVAAPPAAARVLGFSFTLRRVNKGYVTKFCKVQGGLEHLCASHSLRPPMGGLRLARGRPNSIFRSTSQLLYSLYHLFDACPTRYRLIVQVTGLHRIRLSDAWLNSLPFCRRFFDRIFSLFQTPRSVRGYSANTMDHVLLFFTSVWGSITPQSTRCKPRLRCDGQHPPFSSCCWLLLFAGFWMFLKWLFIMSDLDYFVMPPSFLAYKNPSSCISRLFLHQPNYSLLDFTSKPQSLFQPLHFIFPTQTFNMFKLAALFALASVAIAAPLERRQSGTATYYSQNGSAGSCGTVHSDSDYIVALPSSQDPSGNCGKSVSISSDSGSITATVADTCVSLKDSIKMSLTECSDFSPFTAVLRCLPH